MVPRTAAGRALLDPTTDAGHALLSWAEEYGFDIVDDILAIEAEASEQGRKDCYKDGYADGMAEAAAPAALDVERLARALVKHYGGREDFRLEDAAAILAEIERGRGAR